MPLVVNVAHIARTLAEGNDLSCEGVATRHYSKDEVSIFWPGTGDHEIEETILSRDGEESDLRFLIFVTLRFMDKVSERRPEGRLTERFSIEVVPPAAGVVRRNTAEEACAAFDGPAFEAVPAEPK